MCGICGIFSPGTPVNPERVVPMRETMPYRGPDAAGIASGDGWALGHRRLSVIDLSEVGRQPMTNEDGSIEIVLNGEIYNFATLRPELERAGHRFTSRTDTEVLVHGYEEWGLGELLRRVRGMFAFALIDKRRNELHLARDPLGKKPLYFRHRDGEVLFASSVRALARALPRTPAVDVTAVHDLLWHLYIPGPRTIFEEVEKLPGGRAVTFDGNGGRTEMVHWRPDFSRPEAGHSTEEWLEQIEAALTTAVERRLVSDVPLGVMLSGGVDSSLVTAIAARLRGRVKTFSVASNDAAIDERQYAEMVARHCGTDHHVLVVSENVRDLLLPLVSAMGEPLADPSAMNLFAISRLARQHVTVALTGDGGDEAFGGYPHFLAAHLADRLRGVVPAAVRPLLDWLGRSVQNAPAALRKPGTVLRLAGESEAALFSRFGRILDDDARSALFSGPAAERLRNHDAAAHYLTAARESTATSRSSRLMDVQMRTLLQDDYLAKADIGTMAASLEGRAPFLDVDLIDLALRIPPRQRFHRGEPKGLLRELARRHVPAAAIDRPKKGFVAPVGAWLCGPWRNLVDETVLGPEVERRGWFRRQGLQRIVDRQRGGGGGDYIVWGLLLLELWMRMTIDADDGPETIVESEAPLC